MYPITFICSQIIFLCEKNNIYYKTWFIYDLALFIIFICLHWTELTEYFFHLDKAHMICHF